MPSNDLRALSLERLCFCSKSVYTVIVIVPPWQSLHCNLGGAWPLAQTMLGQASKTRVEALKAFGALRRCIAAAELALNITQTPTSHGTVIYTLRNLGHAESWETVTDLSVTADTHES